MGADGDARKVDGCIRSAARVLSFGLARGIGNFETNEEGGRQAGRGPGLDTTRGYGGGCIMAEQAPIRGGDW